MSITSVSDFAKNLVDIFTKNWNSDEEDCIVIDNNDYVVIDSPNPTFPTIADASIALDYQFWLARTEKAWEKALEARAREQRRCSWCGSLSPDDERGNCAACGGMR